MALMLKKWGAPRRKREEGTFSSVRKIAVSSRRNTVLVILVSAAIGGWLYVFFGSGFFEVREVQVSDLLYADRGAVIRTVYAAVDEQGKGRNLFLLDTAALQQELESELYAEKVTVDKQYPHILRLNIQERQSSVIVIANQAFYLVDRHGIGVERISSEEEAAVLQRIADPSTATPQDLPILRVSGNVSFKAGELFVSAWMVEGWLQAFEALQKASFGYRQAALDYVTSTKLILDLYEPYDVYFDLLAPMEPQINSFYAFMRAKDPKMTVEEYVDVRVPGKIYYR